jgi:hypothetical protein
MFLSDQDDVWLPGRRNAFLSEFASHPSAELVISDLCVIDADSSILAESFMSLRGGFHGGPFSTLVKSRYIGCAIAVRRSLLAVALPIPQWAPMHDSWLGLIASVQRRARYIPTQTILYRRHGSNASPSRHRAFPLMLKDRAGLIAALVLWLLKHRRVIVGLLPCRLHARPPA